MSAKGEDEKMVQYTDLVGTLMTSVTEIVDMISSMMVAFVSISLVVSSIMIGVITYISVLERRKEIGILRAIGASSGTSPRCSTQRPSSSASARASWVSSSARSCSSPETSSSRRSPALRPSLPPLPVDAALFLVALATLLTILAGIIPARGAAKCNPVKALRAE